MNIENLISDRAASLKPSGIRRFFDIASEMDNVISLGVGEPDFKTPYAVRRAAMDTLQRGKTAALLVAACVMGARLAGATPEQEQAARIYGENIGLSFQIIDDILDVTATAEALGKPVGSDSENEKNTYVSLLGLDEARRLAAQRTHEALIALEVFGDNAASLRQLAEALLTRDH